MTGKSHLISAVTCAVCADAGFKLITDISDKQSLFANYREYITSGLLPAAPKVEIASAALAEVYTAQTPVAVSVLLVVLSIVFLFFGCLLPDIDSKKSLLGRFIHVPVKHRTFTHSMFFALPFIIGGIFFRPLLWLAFGMLTHFFCDSWSRAGVCWFWPFSQYVSYEGGAFVKKGHFLKLYRTGEWSEYFWVIVSIVFAAVLASKAYFGLF
jgi:hypothetical protein